MKNVQLTNEELEILDGGLQVLLDLYFNEYHKNRGSKSAKFWGEKIDFARSIEKKLQA